VFREVQRDISVIYDFATTDALRTALSFGCRALHFSGHGHESHLNFEDGRSGLQLVNVDTLRSLLSAGGLRLDFVFVSACHSKPTGQAFVDAGVKHVVCVKIEAMIQDSSAMAFTRAFYLALLSGQTVKHSFLIAKEALKASPCIADSVLEGEKFVLLPENETHDVPIFLSSHVLEWVSPTYGNSHIPSPPPDFEGREVDMHRIITTLLARRLVSVVGAVGQGKSSLTAAVVTYMNDRKTMFEDGIVYLMPHGTSKLSSHRSFLSALLAAILAGPAAVASRLQELQKENLGVDLGNNMSLGRVGTEEGSGNGSGNSNGSGSSSRRDNGEMDGGAGEPDPVYLIEELIVSVLSPFKLLLVLDHIEGLLTNIVSDTATDLKFFLGRLFERCRHLKVLVVSGEAMGMGQVSGFGVVENTVSVGPLSLRSSLRLFARLAPALTTSQRKASFVSALMPTKPDVTVHCRELTICSMKLLALFGNGNPSSIVKLACESTLESVEKLMAEGVDIIFTIEGNTGDVVRRRTVSATPTYVLPTLPLVMRGEQ
jgi:CHAT domain